MRTLTLLTLATLLIMSLLKVHYAAALRSYDRRRDIDRVESVAELGWKVPLLSGAHALPLPAADKVLKYLTLGRGTMTYECHDTISDDDQPAYLHQNTDLYDVAPLAQNLPDEDALHALVPELCEYDYSELRNASTRCVGRIYNQFGHTIVDLFAFSVPPFTIEVTWAIPSPAGQAVNGYWDHSATIDKDWEVYRVETAGGVSPTTCQGHENSTFDVAYAAEYWFYHR